MLCIEHGVKKVFLDKETHTRIKEITPFPTTGGVRFMGVYFTIKK